MSDFKCKSCEIDIPLVIIMYSMQAGKPRKALDSNPTVLDLLPNVIN
jgi:hypothetical protein